MEIADFLISQGYADADAYRVSFLGAAILGIIGFVVLLYSYRLIDSLSDPTESTEENTKIE